jgi:hypothetical protein
VKVVQCKDVCGGRGGRKKGRREGVSHTSVGEAPLCGSSCLRAVGQLARCVDASPAVLCRDAVWSAGINFTLVDLSCAGGDYLAVHAGEDAGSPVLWRGCRVTPPFVVWQNFTASVSAASMLVRVTVGTGSSSGVGTGWQVSTDGLPRIVHFQACVWDVTAGLCEPS